jgi:hypothetical protein
MTESSQSKFDYDVPVVSYDPITNDDGLVIGQQVQPPFELTWDHLTTLRHFAALIEHRTGTIIRVSPADPPPLEDDEPSVETENFAAKQDELYDVLTAHTTGGPAAYEVTWAWMSGYETGIHELVWSSKESE